MDVNFLMYAIQQKTDQLQFASESEYDRLQMEIAGLQRKVDEVRE